MIDTRLIGPKDDQYAVLSLGTVWLATTKKPYAEAVSAAIVATIAGGGAADAAPSATAATAAWTCQYNGTVTKPCKVCDCGMKGYTPQSLQVEERRTPWIKVEDRLPGDEDSSGGRVLCYAPHNDLMYALEPEELRDQVNFAKAACIWKYWQRMPCAPDMKSRSVGCDDAKEPSK